MPGPNMGFLAAMPKNGARSLPEWPSSGCFDEGLDDPGPGARDVPPVVAAAAEPEDAPGRMAVGDGAESRGGMGMRFLRQLQVRDRVPAEAVGTALEDDEFRRVPLEMGLDRRPNAQELRVACARRQRHVELGPDRCAGARLGRGAGARIQEASVLVRVGEDHRRIVLVGVEDAVPVMRVDVDVRDAREPVGALQVLDDDADVVEDAEARGMRAPGMVQPGDRHEPALRLALHHGLGRDERGAHHVAGRLEDALDGGCITGIEVALAGRRARQDEIDVRGVVKELELPARRCARRELQDAPVEPLRYELAPERVVAVQSERMAIGKAIACDPLAGDDAGGRSAVFSHAMPPRLEEAGPRLARPGEGWRRGPASQIIRAPWKPLDRMAQYIYTMNRVGKVVPPKRHILRDISLSFFPGAKIGVLGLNGSGKSTLLRIMAGVDTDIEGEARPQPGIKVGLLPQEPQLDPAADVRSIVEESVKPVKDALARLEQVYVQYSEPDADFDKLAAEQGQLEAFLASVDGHNLERQLDVAADALRLPPWDAKVSQLSGGERRRVALCRLLLSKPDMLLLDEPTNHLDAESVAWLEKYLEQYPSTVICVTHDRYFLDNVAGWILELDRGHGIPWQGNYSSWLEQKEQRLAQEEKQQEGLRRTLARELEWVRANPKARQAKSKARLRQFEELSSVEFQARNETNEIYIPPGPRLGDLVIEVEHLRKAYGERLLIDDLSFRLPPGGIVGIIGPNGAGKTTLFRMLAGTESPTRVRSAGARRSALPTSTSRATSSTTRRPFGRRSPAGRTSSRSATTRRLREAMSGASTSAAISSSSRSASCRAASATACTSRRS